MTVDFDDLRAKALAATPGPWVQQPDGWTVRRVVEQADTDTARGWRVAYTHASGPERVEQEVADADYIAAANPAVILALLDELAALRADAERYRWLRDDKSNSLHLSRNGEHACNYVTAREWIEECSQDWFADDPPGEVAAMKETDTIWTLQIYPNTPIGFNVWNAATLDAAIDRARGAT